MFNLHLLSNCPFVPPDLQKKEVITDQQLFSHVSPVAEILDQEGRKQVDSGSSAETKLKERLHINNSETWCEAELKPHQCDACGKAYKNKYRYQVHLRTHTGEKPYVCSTCGKGFRESANLSNHLKSHRAETPYVCEKCGKGFRWRANLKSHLGIQRDCRRWREINELILSL